LAGNYYEMTFIPATSNIYQVSGMRVATAGSVAFTRDATNRVFLYLKPVGCRMTFGLTPTVTTSGIASPYTTIKSTGYYGGVGRSLVARIDRQSGTIYDIFDSVIYEY